MALQMSTTLRNARLDQIETTVGTTAKLQIWSGSAPANCAAAATGTKLAEITMASDWAANAGSGQKTLNNLPLSSTALAAGSVGYFRIVDNAGTTCHMQGTCGTSGTDMTTDAASFSSIGQAFNVTGFTWTEGGA